MSLINFKSERESGKQREELRKARNKVLQKAEADFNRKKLEEDKRKQRGDDRWLVPSVESRIRESNKGTKKVKKNKKEKKKKEKKKKKKRHKSESSSVDSEEEEEEEEEEWVEKSSSFAGEKQKKVDDKPHERDSWMIPSGDISDLVDGCTDQSDVRGGRKGKDRDPNKVDLDKLGQSDRELNPYWKYGGTGLPQEQVKTETSANYKGVGDGGAEWLRRALRRAKEQAAEEGRSLEVVAAERWGSLQHLHDMMAEAEGRSRSGFRRPAFRKPTEDDGSNAEREVYGHHKSGSREQRQHSVSQERPNCRKDGGYRRDSSSPRRGNASGWRDSKMRERSQNSYDRHQDHRSDGRSSAWKKLQNTTRESKEREEKERSPRSVDKGDRRKLATSKSPRKPSSTSSSDSEKEVREKSISVEQLTDLEMNELAAKLVKAEILGNDELASQLRAKLEAARCARDAAISGKKDQQPEEEVIVLTRTDAKGNIRPAVTPSFKLEDERWGGRRGKKANRKNTHDSKGHRVQYFADDASFSIQDLYQREKFISASDQQAEFVKLAGEDEEGRAAMMRSSSGKAEHGRSVSDSRWLAKSLQECRWCLGGKLLPKHLIAALGEQVYLCVPPHRSLIEGHCLLVPSQHVSCSTQLDEDVWEEMQRFRKALVTMFMDQGLDTVFFETAVNLSKMPHMVLECVPVPKEAGFMAPIYFKKAIQECEMEWSMNKKLVELDGSRTVRRAIPRGLAYFWVGFGNEDKFAHVIEDEKNFPKNFAQETVGGMLELDHTLWRKPRMENFDVQRQKVLQFSEWWKPYDFTRGTKRAHNSSSSSSSSSSSESE